MGCIFRGDCFVELVNKGNSCAALPLAVKAIMEGCHDTASLANAAYAAHQSGVGANIALTSQDASALNHVPNAKQLSGPSTGIV